MEFAGEHRPGRREQAPPPESAAAPREEAEENGLAVPAPKPQARAGHANASGGTSVLQRLYRRLILLIALYWAFVSLKHMALSPRHFGAIFLATLATLAVRLVPVAKTRQDRLTLTIPALFALMIWLGAEPAAIGVLAGGLLEAHFGPARAPSRNYRRFQAAVAALSALVVGIFPAIWRHAPLHLTPLDNMHASSLASTLSGGMLLPLVCALLTLPANHIASIRAASRRYPYGAWVCGYAAVILPTALLATLAVPLAPTATFFFLTLCICGGVIARISAEVNSLHNQLRIAQAMGRAGIADDADQNTAALLQRFLSLARGLVEADQATAWTFDQTSGELAPEAALPTLSLRSERPAVLGEGLLGSAADTPRPSLIPDAAQDTRRTERERTPGAWLVYPMVARGRLLGVARWSRSAETPFTADDVARLESLITQVSVSLENVRIRRGIRQLAATDGLTGLWNHRKMQELLRDELRRALRYRRTLSILMLDVDTFKSFNDAYGHPQGDNLLCSIASVLYASVRSSDHVGRYGGEEFMILLPETSKDAAYHLAERMRSAVETECGVVVKGRTVHRTVSLGLASFPEDALNPIELVQRADEALYRAKRDGRNRVTWA